MLKNLHNLEGMLLIWRPFSVGLLDSYSPMKMRLRLWMWMWMWIPLGAKHHWRRFANRLALSALHRSPAHKHRERTRGSTHTNTHPQSGWHRDTDQPQQQQKQQQDAAEFEIRSTGLAACSGGPEPVTRAYAVVFAYDLGCHHHARRRRRREVRGSSWGSSTTNNNIQAIAANAICVPFRSVRSSFIAPQFVQFSVCSFQLLWGRCTRTHTHPHPNWAHCSGGWRRGC